MKIWINNFEEKSIFWGYDEIDFVLPIGGSPKNPFIIDALKQYFKNADMLLPDEKEIDLLVSKGAVLYAKNIALHSSLPIIPITPDKIGILVKGENFSTIINSYSFMI